MVSSQQDTIRILIADDYDLARMSLEILLKTLPNFEIVGQASNGEEAVQLCQTVQPDVLLTDYNMPVMNGIEAARQVRRLTPNTRIIMLTNNDMTEDFKRQARDAGITRVLSKVIVSDEILTAVHTALNSSESCAG